MTRFLVAVALLLATVSGAFAQGYPTKPVRILVAFAPGGPADITARLVAQKLPEILGQQVIVDNRAGAGGNIAAAVVAKSPPDGYTALVTTSAIAVNMTLFANPGYDAERDFAPVIQIATQPNMIFVTAAAPARNLDELITGARGTKFVYASPGAGTTPHLTAEMLFKVLARLDASPVHYKGAGPMVAAVVGGEPAVGTGAISGPLAQVRAGKLRALAVSSSQRLATLPEVPTLTESGFAGMEDYTWIAMFLPAGTPPEIVQRLNEAVNLAIQAPEIRQRLEGLAFEPVGGSQSRFAEYVKAEVAKWAKVVRDTGAKSD
jgi:tripartite-type tricarboxylate transporter receptor subunit TctC